MIHPRFHALQLLIMLFVMLWFFRLINICYQLACDFQKTLFCTNTLYKMKNVLFVFVALLLTNFAFSQQTEYAIKLVKKSNPDKVRYIEQGRRMKVYTNDNTEYAGRLYIPTDSTLRIDAITLPADQIPKIRGNSTGLLIAKIAGGALGAFGLFVAGVGVAIIVDALQSNNGFAVILLFPVGLIVSAAGVGGTLIGSSVLFVNGKKYDLRDKWDMSIVPVSELPQ